MCQHTAIGVSRRKCLEGQKGGRQLLDSKYMQCRKGIHIPQKIYHVQWRTFNSICSYTLKIYTYIIDCYIKEYYSICFIKGYLWLFCQKGGEFAPNAPPCICHYMNAIYSYNLHCVLFTLLPVFFYYIIKNLREARLGLGEAKPLFATPQKCPCIYCCLHLANSNVNT